MSAEKEMNGNRTHEPSLRELTAELDGLRDVVFEKITSLKDIIDERDRLYKERDESRKTAVDAALAAAKEQNKQTFESSEKAIVKAEEGQRSYNASHNDLARKMDEQNKATMPRTESQQRFDALTKELGELKAVVAAGGAALLGGKTSQENTRANLAIIVAFIGLLMVIAARIFGK